MLRTMRISVKLAIIYMLILFVSWMMIFFLFAGIRSRESRNYAKALSAQTLNTVGRNVTTIIDNAAYYSRIILSSSEVTGALEAGDGERQKESLYQFISLVDSETHINGIYMWDMYDHACSIDRNHVRSLRTENVSGTNWYEEVMALGGSYCLKLNADRVLTQSSAQTCVSLIRVVNNPFDYQPVGILMINIDLEAFVGCYESVDAQSVPCLYILDQTGKIVASRSEITLPEFQAALASGRESFLYGDRKVFPASLEADGIDWVILAGTVTENSLDKSAAGGFLVATVMISLAVFCFAAFFFTRRDVANPLEDMADSMNRMEGKKFEKICTDSRGAEFSAEMGILKDTYNQMVDEIDTLIEQVYEEEKIKRKTELNALQEQMKPHFLYNTIDAMGYLALSGRSQEVYDALEAFGSYYRILLSKGKELITVREEIEMVRDYLELLKIRYGDELHYVLDVDENICDDYILKMILQPLVENAVNHGIRPKTTRGMVCVEGKEEDGYLCFSVADDGVGMSSEKMAELQRENLDSNEKSFGLRGTIERIKIFYEQDIGYDIQSTEGRGTVITLRVPVYYEGDESDD